MPTILNFRRKYGLQCITNNDLVEHTVKPYQLMLEGPHTLCHAPSHARVYCNHHWICDALLKYQQYTCRYLGCNNCIRTIVHVIPVSGYVVLVMFVMFWKSRSLVTESIKSASSKESNVVVSGIEFD